MLMKKTTGYSYTTRGATIRSQLSLATYVSPSACGVAPEDCIHRIRFTTAPHPRVYPPTS